MTGRVGFVFLLLLAAALPAAAAEAPLQRLSLKEALALLAENSALRGKAFELKAKEAQIVTAGLRPNPTLSYSPNQVVPFRDIDNTVAIGQTFETAGKRELRVDSAQRDALVSGLQVRDFERQLSYQVKSAFVAAQVAVANLRLAETNLATLDEVDRILKLRARTGDISQIDLLRLEGQRYDFEKDAADARQNLANAKSTLRTIAPQRIAPDFAIDGELAYADLPRPARDDLAQIVLGRTDVRAADAAKDKAQIDINLAEANAVPDVTPNFGYTRTHDGRDIVGLSVNVPLPVFDRNQGEITRAKADAARLAAERETAVTQALADLDQALAAYEASRRKSSLLRDTYLPKAKEARDRVELAYRRGGISLLDFIDAERTYRTTALSYTQSLGDYWTAFYQIEAATGVPMREPR
jgi:cobalt-zinc-cadmium efflux system outer membrane protein